MQINLTPIAFVKNSRTEVEDDNWGQILSEIILADDIPANAIIGLSNFSHLEIIYYFHKGNPAKAIPQYRHPRGNTNYPKVGTFAQRNKHRPNLLGLTTVELVEQKERSIIVKNLDAINGTPILDIKPIMKEFLPIGTIQQPDWSSDLMKNYW